jgi:hypothetical protein
MMYAGTTAKAKLRTIWAMISFMAYPFHKCSVAQGHHWVL